RTFDHQSDALGCQPPGLRLTVAVHRPKQRPRLDPRDVQPGLQRAHGAGVGPRPVRNPDHPPGALLVSFRAAYRNGDAFTTEDDVTPVQADQFAAAEGT